MTLSSIAALFSIMVIGALIPGVSVLTVTARSASSGFIHGIFVTLGIITGDIFYILLAIFGLSVLFETMGDLFILVKYFGGTYLIWLGITLYRSKLHTIKSDNITKPSLISSFLAGLLITLADQKAILFYFGFFPAFIDLSTLTSFDTSIIIMLAVVAISSVKLSYAFIAVRTRLLFKSVAAMKKINTMTGVILMGVGIFILIK